MSALSTPTSAPSRDLLLATADLVNIASVSHHEAEITDHIEARLRAVPWLEVTRIDHNLVARTNFGLAQRLILAGHTDTVPVNNNAAARIEGDLLFGVGSTDMKGGVAVFLELAENVSAPTVDLTFVFYECEEVAAVHNGLKKLLAQRPELVAGDAAILGEPTEAIIEAGCQGTLRAELSLRGTRSHVARPWMGRNAIHRAGIVLARLEAYQSRRPTIDGCEFREAMQAVKIEGGVAGNVVPDLATITINHRFAPDRTIEQATDQLRTIIGQDILDDEATFTVTDAANAAAPSLTHPLFAGLASRTDAPPRAKLGWTDVAFFAAQGVPAVNFGPGDPTIAHTQGEFVKRKEIEHAYAVLHSLITT
jgi:succinyl-diaminopimelate desuccinylase